MKITLPDNTEIPDDGFHFIGRDSKLYSIEPQKGNVITSGWCVVRKENGRSIFIKSVSITEIYAASFSRISDEAAAKIIESQKS